MLEAFQPQSLFFQQHNELFVIQMNAFVSYECFYMENNSWSS